METNYQDTISKNVSFFTEMTQAKNDWIDKVRKWREECTEKGITEILFEESFPDGVNGYFYKDTHLSKSSVEMGYVTGTPVLIDKISCFINTGVNYTQNGELFPTISMCIEIIFYCESESSYTKSLFPGELRWGTPLFSTILEYSNKKHFTWHDTRGIGFGSQTGFINLDSTNGDGWVMLFTDDSIRKLIVKKLKNIATCLRKSSKEYKNIKLRFKHK